MPVTSHWQQEPGWRLHGTRPLDCSKLQAPCIFGLSDGSVRLYYTAVGPAKPYRACQGYILSAVSDDGLNFRVEPGLRLAPQPGLPHMSLRILAPTIVRCGDGCWRMYFESRGSADRPTVICSAISTDLLRWEHEPGIRLQSPGGLGGPRIVSLPDGGLRMYCFQSDFGPAGRGGGERLSQQVVSAYSDDGLDFEFDPGMRLRDRQSEVDSLGITAAEVIPPAAAGDEWTMFYSAWQDVPPGTPVPVHPSQSVKSADGAPSEDFAAASIASDMAGYRSRIFRAVSQDGLQWEPTGCVIEGGGYGAEGVDAVHAEDLSLIALQDGTYRMYYAACDSRGNWGIASAVTAQAGRQSI